MRPSKNLIIIASVCILALGGVVYAKYKNSPATTRVHKSLIPAAGTPSGLTVLQDKVSSNTTTPKTSITKSVSQDFAKQLVDLQASGSLNNQSEAELIQNLSTQYATTSLNLLILSDIRTFSDLDKGQTRAFGNATADAIISYYPILKTNPFDILDAVKNGQASSTDLMVQMAPIVKAYRSLALDLQKIPAPANLAADYLSVINGYITLGEDVENMAAYSSDPVRSFIGINNYTQDALNQADLLKNIHDYFDTNGILFSNTEKGSIWSSVTQ